MNGLNAAQFLTKQTHPRFLYAYYDRQYHESYGARHDGNPPHRIASGRREEVTVAISVGGHVQNASRNKGDHQSIAHEPVRSSTTNGLTRTDPLGAER
jgi:hypothetical protein